MSRAERVQRDEAQFQRELAEDRRRDAQAIEYQTLITRTGRGLLENVRFRVALEALLDEHGIALL